MKDKKAVITRDLSIGYKQKSEENVIGKNINLELNYGSLVALVGINGVGKSTLLRTLSGIQKPLKGQVFLNDIEIRDYDEATLAQNLSLVLTERLPPSNLTVYEIVALGRQPYTNWIGRLSSKDKEQISNAISLTGISEMVHKKHYEISDGQLQKVLIARALAQDTEIIILDEPTTHLDLQHKASLLQLLKKLARETDKCILYSTHDIDMAIQVCDQMIIMSKEKVLFDNPCNFISNKSFDSIFEDKNISFDEEKAKFIFKKI